MNELRPANWSRRSMVQGLAASALAQNAPNRPVRKRLSEVYRCNTTPSALPIPSSASVKTVRQSSTSNGYPEGNVSVEAYQQPTFLERLPEPMRVKSGHGGSHTFLTHEFISAIAFTLPGIVAHQSALRGGEVLKIRDYGTAPA